MENNNSKTTKVHALYKVFYIAEELLLDENCKLRLESFYHPGKCQSALFVTHNNVNIMEVLEFQEPRRSWLINSDVCSNGRIYLTTPIDITFLALHHLRKHCTHKALALDNIIDQQDPSTARLMVTFVREQNLHCLADVKKVDDMKFYKYNAEKTLAWLAVKTQRVSLALKNAGVHVGHSAQSLNYASSEIVKEDEQVDEMDFLRMACDYVGGYLDLELYVELINYLEIPNKALPKTEEKKRKSLQSLNNGDNKKLKLEEPNHFAAAESLKESSLLDSSSDEVASKSTQLKERTLSTKEKALAKSAKGTRSISSFFKK